MFDVSEIIASSQDLPALGFVCLFVRLYGDVSITAAYYRHLADLSGASAAAAFAVLAPASASAHRTSPLWVDNNRITLHSKVLVLKRHWPNKTLRRRERGLSRKRRQSTGIVVSHLWQIAPVLNQYP